VFTPKNLRNVRINKLLKKDFSMGRDKQLDPLWVTGFVDAEGCFSIIIEILECSK